MKTMRTWARVASRGFTLIEVLVAILVVALGALAAGSLHLRALRETSESAYRSAAIQLARDLTERIKANRYIPNLADPSNPIDNVPNYLALTNTFDLARAANTSSTCYNGGCTNQERVEHDVAEWTQSVGGPRNSGGRLPGGIAILCRVANPSLSRPSAPGCAAAGAVPQPPLTIMFWWSERDVLADQRQAPQAPTDSNRPPLFYMAVNP